MKNVLDRILAFLGLVISAPIIAPVILLVWLGDRKSPFYIADRTGKAGANFQMVKLRSMVQGADLTGVDSTSAEDRRITPVGHFIRRYKLDEITQLWNVLKGDMSLVGPRPNVPRETKLYTTQERRLLTVKPGITDFSSIVFSDEGEILKGSQDPDLAYNQLIRPAKSRLGLVYVDKRSLFIDLQLILLTVLAVFSRETALKHVVRLLKNIGADEKLCKIASRKEPLEPAPPPGAEEIVSQR